MHDTRQAMVIDHDAGTNPDDALAFLFLLHSPQVDIRMTISGNKQPLERAVYAHKFFTLMGTQNIPHYAGETTGHVAFLSDAIIKDHAYDPPADYRAALARLCEEREQVTYLAIQGLSNLDSFLSHHPEYAHKLKVFHMGMTLAGADMS